MKQTDQWTEQLVDEYSMMLLNWAYKKVYDRDKAEELVQSVWVEVFRAIRKDQERGIPIQKPEHLIWKIAHYVWCHYLRKTAGGQVYISTDEMELADGTDFVQELADSEEAGQRLKALRRRIASLNYLQREVMISFYIDGQSIKTIAGKLGITEAAVKWHLFDTRKKLKEELTTMTTNDYVYRPRTLHVAISGTTGLPCDIDVIRDSLTKQNICVACYQTPKTLDELTEELGIPKAYLEFDIAWLVEKEFLHQTKQGYSTSFMIETAQNEQDIWEICLKHRKTVSDVILEGLTAAEEQIRQIGFYGCEKPMEQLLWTLLYRFHESLKNPGKQIERPIRPDGGKYFPLGFDRSDAPLIPQVVDTQNWSCNGPMWSEASTGGRFCWYGLYDFADADSMYIVCYGQPEWQKMNEVLCTLLQNDFRIGGFDEEQQLSLAKLIEKGFVRKEGEKAYPNFLVFTAEQYRQLEQTVFAPLEQKLEGAIAALLEDLAQLCRKKIPKQLTDYYGLFLQMAFGRLSYLNTILAFQEGMLYVPAGQEEGKLLTLLYIGE